MRNNYRQILLSIGLLLFASAISAQPVNDDWSNAILVQAPVAVFGETITATAEAPVPPFCVTSIQAPGVWYRVLGDGGMSAVASTRNPTGGAPTDYDTKLNVYTESGGTLTCITGNDDVGGLQSQVDWIDQVGQEYLILVQGFGGAVGNFGLNVTNASQPPILSLSTAAVNFGGVQVGETSSQIVVTATNTGTSAIAAPLDITAVNLPAGTPFAVTSTCGAGMAPGDSCDIAITFSPVDSGSFSAQITLNNNAGADQIIALSGLSSSGAPQAIPLLGSSGVILLAFLLSMAGLRKRNI